MGGEGGLVGFYLVRVNVVLKALVVIVSVGVLLHPHKVRNEKFDNFPSDCRLTEEDHCE